MTKQKFIHLILYNVLSLVALLILFANGKFTNLFHLLLLVLTVYNLVRYKNKFFSLVYLYTLLLLSTYLPIILVQLNFIFTIINDNNVRHFILIQKYYELAGDLIILASFLFSSYLPLSKPFVFAKKNRLRGMNLFVVEVVVLTLSLLVNKNSNIILFDNYAGDGYVEGTTFGGWSSFFIIFIAYYIYESKLATTRNVVFIILILAIWFLFGNRGEIFAIAIFLLLKKFGNGGNIKWNKLLFWGGGMLVLFFSIGLFRGGNSFDFSNSVQSFIADFTGAPVAYTLMATIYHVEYEGFMHGATFADYLLRIFPSFITPNRPQDVSSMIAEKYSSIGGMHFLAESYLNFGIIGIFAQIHIFGLLFTAIEKKASRSYYFQYLYIVLIFLGTRTVWYGFITLYKVFLFLTIVIFFIHLTKDKNGVQKFRY